MNETSFINIINSNKDLEGRTSPIYVADRSRLSLDDILHEKPYNKDSQIHISWFEDSLNKKLLESKYSAWDAFSMPEGVWSSSVYGGSKVIVAGINGKLAVYDTLSGEWHEVAVIDNITCVSYGKNKDVERFIALSSNGAGIYSDDLGLSWQSLQVPEDSYSSLIYVNGRFLSFASSGRVYASFDMGASWEEKASFDMQITCASHDNNSRVIALGNQGNVLCIYSEDSGETFKTISVENNNWCSVVYGDNKFIAVSLNGVSRIMYLNILSEDKVCEYVKVPEYSYRSISYGNGVFSAVALEGRVLSSNGGVKWVEMLCPEGEWNNIVRTDYFFMAFSVTGEESGLNCMRSSNGGFSNINFAELDEVISQENINKAINPSVLRDYLSYKTGRNKGQYPVYEDNKYIDCVSSESNQLHWYVIDEESALLSFDEIEKSGRYLILKDLEHKPQDKETFYILEVESINKADGVVINHKLYNSDGFKYYSRSREQGVWSGWKLVCVTQKDIDKLDLSNNTEVSSNVLYSAVETFLGSENGVIKSVGRVEVIDGIKNEITLNLDSRYAEKGHNHTLVEITNTGALAGKDRVNLVTDVEGVLNETNGGVGYNNVYNVIKGKNISPSSIDFYGSDNFIDFHFNNSSADYTTRIGEFSEGQLSITSPNGLLLNGNHVAVQSNITVTDGNTQWAETQLKNGQVRLEGWGVFNNQGWSKASVAFKAWYRNVSFPKPVQAATLSGSGNGFILGQYYHYNITRPSMNDVINYFLITSVPIGFTQTDDTMVLNCNWYVCCLLA